MLKNNSLLYIARLYNLETKSGNIMKNIDQKVNSLAVNNTIEPQFLYKYYTFNKYTERIFTHNEIYFPAPKEFNDPFDSKVRLSYEGTKKKWKEYLLQVYERRRPDLTKE